jgi:hypothetical protein
MCLYGCYLDSHEAGLCCYPVIHTENLLHPLQLFYFHLWPTYWLFLPNRTVILILALVSTVFRKTFFKIGPQSSETSAVITISAWHVICRSVQKIRLFRNVYNVKMCSFLFRFLNPFSLVTPDNGFLLNVLHLSRCLHFVLHPCGIKWS